MGPQRPERCIICPPKTVRCGPEKLGTINNREAQKICGAPESAGPLALAQSAPPPLNPALVIGLKLQFVYLTSTT